MQLYRIKKRRQVANHIKKGLSDNLEAGSFARPGENLSNPVSLLLNQETISWKLPRQHVTRMSKQDRKNVFPKKELLSTKKVSNKLILAFPHHLVMNKHVPGLFLEKKYTPLPKVQHSANTSVLITQVTALSRDPGTPFSKTKTCFYNTSKRLVL